MIVVRHVTRRFPDLEALSRDAAAFFLKIATVCAQHKRIASIVLSGGSTPRMFYEILGHEPFRRMVPWQDIHLFWGDERFVLSDSPESNYHIAQHALIDAVPIPARNIHRITTEHSSPDHAAREYERELRNFFPGHVAVPPFDLAILGVGADGHTASLFPGDPALREKARWVLAVNAPPGVKLRQRITLTMSAINSAQYILVLVARPGKEHIIDAMQHGCHNNCELPVSMLAPRNELRFYIADNIMQ